MVLKYKWFLNEGLNYAKCTENEGPLSQAFTYLVYKALGLTTFKILATIFR